MTPLPSPLGGPDVVAWRIDERCFAATWDSGEGAFQFGGRWNSRGVRVIYCALDPATAILEVAVHKGFDALDRAPHVLTALTLLRPADAHVVMPQDIPDPDWLAPGVPGAGQQSFGDMLLDRHGVLFIPSVVSKHSWNMLIAVPAATGTYTLRSQEPLGIDTRLNPAR